MRRFDRRAFTTVHKDIESGNLLCIAVIITPKCWLSNIYRADLIRKINRVALESSLDKMHRGAATNVDTISFQAFMRHSYKAQ